MAIIRAAAQICDRGREGVVYQFTDLYPAVVGVSLNADVTLSVGVDLNSGVSWSR